QRARQRIGDVGDAGERGLQRLWVEAHRAIRQVVVVDQDQFASGNSLQRWNIRGFAFDVKLFPVSADQLARSVVVVDSDRKAVHPSLTGAGLRAALGDGEAGEPPDGVDVEVGTQR